MSIYDYMNHFWSESEREAANAISDFVRTGKKLPADFAELLIQNYRCIDPDYDTFLMSIPEYLQWAAKRKVFRNGNV